MLLREDTPSVWSLSIQSARSMAGEASESLGFYAYSLCHRSPQHNTAPSRCVGYVTHNIKCLCAFFHRRWRGAIHSPRPITHKYTRVPPCHNAVTWPPFGLQAIYLWSQPRPWSLSSNDACSLLPIHVIPRFPHLSQFINGWFRVKDYYQISRRSGPVTLL